MIHLPNAHTTEDVLQAAAAAVHESPNPAVSAWTASLMLEQLTGEPASETMALLAQRVKDLQTAEQRAARRIAERQQPPDLLQALQNSVTRARTTQAEINKLTEQG